PLPFFLASKRADHHPRLMRHCFLLLFLSTLIGFTQAARSGSASSSEGIHKLRDLIIYKEEKFYSTFPSIVRRSNGELLVAFRRAPERRGLGESAYTHTDPNSYLVLVRSHDDGLTWS